MLFGLFYLCSTKYNFYLLSSSSLFISFIITINQFINLSYMKYWIELFKLNVNLNKLISENYNEYKKIRWLIKGKNGF